MCSGSEAGSYLRLIDCVYDSTLGLRVITKKRKKACLLAAEDLLKRPVQLQEQVILLILQLIVLDIAPERE